MLNSHVHETCNLHKYQNTNVDILFLLSTAMLFVLSELLAFWG